MSWSSWVLHYVLKPVFTAATSLLAVIEFGPIVAVLVCWLLEMLTAQELLPDRLLEDGTANPERTRAKVELWRARKRRVRLALYVVAAAVTISMTFGEAAGLDYVVCFLSCVYLLTQALSNAQKADGMFAPIREWVGARIGQMVEDAQHKAEDDDR